MFLTSVPNNNSDFILNSMSDFILNDDEDSENVATIKINNIYFDKYGHFIQSNNNITSNYCFVGDDIINIISSIGDDSNSNILTFSHKKP
jgi:hypothetical protein